MQKYSKLVQYSGKRQSKKNPAEKPTTWTSCGEPDLLVPVKVLFELLQGVGFQAWLQLAVEVGGIVSVVLVQDAIKLKKPVIP